MFERKRRFRELLLRGFQVAFALGALSSIVIGGGFSLYQGTLPPVGLVEGLLCIPLAGLYTVLLGSPVIVLVAWLRSGRTTSPNTTQDENHIVDDDRQDEPDTTSGSWSR